MTASRKKLRAAAKRAQLVALRKLYDVRAQAYRVRDELASTKEVREWTSMAEVLEKVNVEISRAESLLAMILLEDDAE